MWTLILVFSLSRGVDGAAIATPVIPGFSSYNTCVAAGNSVANIKRFICVEVK